jgi:sulfide:quinone oxidoreductase
MKNKAHVVVLGAGFAGLEAAFYLRHRMHDRVEITLVSPEDYFLYKPNMIYIPFGEEPDRLKIPLDQPLRRKNIHAIRASALDVDPVARRVEIEGTGKLQYDYLVVATGARMEFDEIPGLKEHAVTVWNPEEMLRLRRGLQGLIREGVGRRRLLFLVPPNNRCSGPLYELAMMTDTWLRRQGARQQVAITFVTYEESYIQSFGPRLNTVVSDEFEERQITGRRGQIVIAIEPNVVQTQSGYRFNYDLLVAFPPYAASVRFSALPGDDRGFIHVEPDSRQVKGHPGIFAVGDGADFPIKQAFLALLQADAAADHLVADIEGKPATVRFEPMSMCVMEEFDKATFAQVPLKYTGDPARPVAVAAENESEYKVGISPIWRVGKGALGLYLPWRFGSGEPFHAGLAWEAMDLGLKVMSKLLAH